MRIFYKIIKFAGPLIITFLILYFLFSKINYREIWGIFVQSDKLVLLLAIIAVFLPIPISALRWKTMMGLTGSSVAYKTALTAYLASLPLSKLSPFNSGDLARAFYVKDEVPLTANVGIIFAENIINLTFVSLLALIGGLILQINSAVLIGAAILLINIAFFIFIPRINLPIRESWKIRLKSFSDIFRILLQNPRSVGLVIFYTFLIWLTILSCFMLIFYALGVNMPFLYITSAQPIAILFGVLPITFSGVGLRESIMVYLYHNIAPVPLVMAAGLCYSFFAVVLLPLCCVPFLFIKTRNIKITNDIHANN